MAFGRYLRCWDEDRRTFWDDKTPGWACPRSKQRSRYCRKDFGADQGAVPHSVLRRLVPGTCLVNSNTGYMLPYDQNTEYNFCFCFWFWLWNVFTYWSWLELLLLKLREGPRFLSIPGDRLVNHHIVNAFHLLVCLKNCFEFMFYVMKYSKQGHLN